MRVVHVCQPTDGGAAVVVRDLARAGRAAGDDVAVVCPAGGYLARWVVESGAHWHEFEMSRAPSPADVARVTRLRGLIRAADAVHLHSSKAGALGRMALSTLRDRPRSVFTPHGWSWYVGGVGAPVYRALERNLAGSADTITAVSEQERRDGLAVLGPTTHIVVVANGVDPHRFTPDGPGADRSEDPLLVQVGRLSEQKGQDRTLRALAELSDQRVRLRLVGDGPMAPRLAALASELNLTDRVEFMGSVDPRPHLRVADLVVLPSRWEGMSLVLLEAMSTGCAVITTDCGGSEALIGAGRIIGQESERAAVAALAGAIADLLPDRARRLDLGRAARARVQADYSLHRVYTAYRRLYVPSSVEAVV